MKPVKPIPHPINSVERYNQLCQLLLRHKPLYILYNLAALFPEPVETGRTDSPDRLEAVTSLARIR